MEDLEIKDDVKFPAAGYWRRLFDRLEAYRGQPFSFGHLGLALKDVVWFFSYHLPFSLFKFIQLAWRRWLMFSSRFYKSYRQADRYRRLSFCTTCMNREEHLRRTLPRNLRDNREYPDLEFVILDYNSRPSLEKWIREKFPEELASGRIALYRTDEPRFFEMAKAKNLAHSLANGEVVCNLDADNYTGKDFAFFINAAIAEDKKAIGVHQGRGRLFSPHLGDCGGRIFLSRNEFLASGGYDEKFHGWGFEDVEFVARIRCRGGHLKDIPKRFLGALSHSDRCRARQMENTLEEARTANRRYLRETLASAPLSVDNGTSNIHDLRRIWK